MLIGLCFFACRPMVYQDASCWPQLHLFTDLVEDALKEFAYDADLAGLQYYFNYNGYGLMVSIEALIVVK